MDPNDVKKRYLWFRSLRKKHGWPKRPSEEERSLRLELVKRYFSGIVRRIKHSLGIRKYEYLIKSGDNRIYPYTDALLERGDMTPCDLKGNLDPKYLRHTRNKMVLGKSVLVTAESIPHIDIILSSQASLILRNERLRNTINTLLDERAGLVDTIILVKGAFDRLRRKVECLGKQINAE